VNNNLSTAQEIHPLAWKPKVHYSVHKTLPPGPYPERYEPTFALGDGLKRVEFIILPDDGNRPSFRKSVIL
jgi:hypothetical protein